MIPGKESLIIKMICALFAKFFQKQKILEQLVFGLRTSELEVTKIRTI